MPTLKNINPLGAVELPLIGRVLEAGEEFEVTAAQAGRPPSTTADDDGNEIHDPGEGLLAQVGNYVLVEANVNLDRMKVDELKAHAAGKGIDIGEATTKADIIAAIRKG